MWRPFPPAYRCAVGHLTDIILYCQVVQTKNPGHVVLYCLSLSLLIPDHIIVMPEFTDYVLVLVSLQHGLKAVSRQSHAILEPCRANQGSLTTGKLGICQGQLGTGCEQLKLWLRTQKRAFRSFIVRQSTSCACSTHSLSMLILGHLPIQLGPSEYCALSFLSSPIFLLLSWLFLYCCGHTQPQDMISWSGMLEGVC